MHKYLMFLFVCLIGSAFADDNTLEDRIRDRFPTASIDSISETEIMGLYEIVISGYIYYVVREFYVFVGW